ncbi:MAG TPA: deoxyribodipyrimidine photo-lyase [Aequorivita sp.]|nr:deoxyribodipyrimidine photo-lyase [Aequorivita sp.]
MTKPKINVFWFRRDLRLEDNVGLFKALQGKLPVLPIFIFDTEIIDELPADDTRVTFIFNKLQGIQIELKQIGSQLSIYHGSPTCIFDEITSQFQIQSVYANHDYEPYAQDRDKSIKNILSKKNVNFYSFKDQVIFEKDEVVKADGKPYLVYTPYMKSWKNKFKNEYKPIDYNLNELKSNFYKYSRASEITLSQLGFKQSKIVVPEYDISEGLIQNYEDNRNFPALNATSRVGPHLRFGTISIRKVIEKASSENNEVFWQELIWREFFMQILWHFPETTHNAFKPKYDRIIWQNNEAEFEKWKEGITGYPLVDAGMRELNNTGFMHNRVRMVAASFLCKHLLIDWRWGEAYFANKLLDYEMSSNVGNWQWAAGCGVDAAPYFRIFNPTTQLKKFDKDLEYIKKWIPEFGTSSYPKMMVDHKEARERCLITYKTALS